MPSKRCIKPSEAKATCEAKGSNYRYDQDTGACDKSNTKAKPEKAPEQAKEQNAPKKAEEQSTSEQASDGNDDDYQPKKKKKNS